MDRVRHAARAAALAALLACEPRAADSAPAATPPGPPSAQQPPPAAIRGATPGTGEAPDILRYETAITLDVGARSVRGTTTIVYAAPHAHAPLVLPRNGLVFEAVRAGGRAVVVDLGAEQLRVPLPAAAGEGRVEIDYQATPEKGLWFSKALVHTGYFTCHWMPCTEEPGDRATFRLSLVVPEEYRVVAGGRELTRAPAEPGRVRVVWDDERPLATYLFGFAAGVFTEATQRAGDVTLRYVGVDVPAAALERRFQPTPDMLRFFSERAGVGLPGPDYTQVLVAGSIAQENSSFSLIGTEELDPILTDPTEDWVIAHELAHQWWGNSITCKDWSHVWLNEGITTFMVAAYKQQRWGAAAYARELGLFQQRHAVAKEANLDVKLAYSGKYPSLRVMRAIVYSKAALFLDLLRRELGEAAFWGGLQRYTREHLGRSVESRDFQRALEAETGRDLSTLFRTWVHD